MNTLIKIILFIVLTINSTIIEGQTNTASYFFDSNGNRTNATVIYMSQSQSNPSPKVEEKLDIDEHNTLNITVLPNPTHGELLIKLDGATTEQLNAPNNIIRVWDMQGKLLFSSKPLDESNIIDLSNYDNGIYIVQLFFNGKTKSYKIVKK